MNISFWVDDYRSSIVVQGKTKLGICSGRRGSAGPKSLWWDDRVLGSRASLSLTVLVVLWTETLNVSS